jgi:hypothetical protein
MLCFLGSLFFHTKKIPNPPVPEPGLPIAGPASGARSAPVSRSRAAGSGPFLTVGSSRTVLQSTVIHHDHGQSCSSSLSFFSCSGYMQICTNQFCCTARRLGESLRRAGGALEGTGPHREAIRLTNCEVGAFRQTGGVQTRDIMG